MQPTLTTDRLQLLPLATTDHAFVRELVNTEGWLTNIGNRHVHTDEEAIAYIQRILDNPNVQYWVVRQQADHQSAGVVTWIQREYLDHPDIGFAFLPAFMGKGYAYEAAQAVLQYMLQQGDVTQVYATTIPSNAPSIRLLQKLGLQFEKEIKEGEDTLHVYAGEGTISNGQ